MSTNSQVSVVQIIADLIADEYTSWFAYQRIKGFSEGPCKESIDRLLGEVAEDEISDHAVLLQDRLSDLTDVMPFDCIAQAIDASNTIAGYASGDTRNIAAMGYILELQSIQNLKNAIHNLAFDVDTVIVLQHILEDEEYHAERFLSLFDKIAPQTLTYEGLESLALGDLVIYVLRSGGYQSIKGYAVRKFGVWSLVVLDEDYRDALIVHHDRFNVSIQEPPCCEVDATWYDDALIQPGFSEPTVSLSVPQSFVTDSAFHKNGKIVLRLKDDLETRKVDGKDKKVAKFNSAEEANKFMEKNEGFEAVDFDESGSVYVSLKSEDDNK